MLGRGVAVRGLRARGAWVRRSRLGRVGLVVVVAAALLGLSGCVADPPPLIGLAVAGNGQATVSWLPPLGIPTPIVAYVVTPVIGNVPQTPTRFNSTATTETVTGLTNGTTYTFEVKAINSLGNDSASSGSSNPVTPAPTAVSLTLGRHHTCADGWRGEVLGLQLVRAAR